MLFASICIVVALTFAVLATAVGQLFFVNTGQSTVKARVQKLTNVPEELKGELGGGGVVEEEKKSLLGGIDLKPIVGRFTGEAYFTRMEEELARADIPLRVSEFLIFRFALVGISILLFSVIFKNIGIGILCGLPFLILHIPFLAFRKGARIKKFTTQLSEFLILIVNSLRAGQTFLQGCSVAVGESADPIAAEFKQVIKEVNLGLPEQESLENMLNRVPTEDLKIVISGYIIQRKVGGNLAEILETTAATIRERVKIKGQIDVLTTQGKLSGGIVASLPFVIGGAISMLNPDYISPLISTIPGYCLIGLALCMQMTGAFIIWRVVDIEI